jgi:hypothetical protein
VLLTDIAVVKYPFNPFVLTSGDLMASEEIDSTPNFETFRECISKAVLQRSEELEERDRRSRKAGNRDRVIAWTESHDPEEMAEFVDVCLSLSQVGSAKGTRI